MKKGLKPLLLILVLALLIIGALAAYNALRKDEKNNDSDIKLTSSETQNDPESNETPGGNKGNYTDFTVYTEDGEKVLLSEKTDTDKPVIINFWATWCGYCKMEMPDFNECFSEYKDEIEFMMVDICGGGQDDREKAAEYIKEEGFDFPVYYDDDLSALTAYYTTGFPTTIVIDKNKNVVYNRSGALTKDQLLSIIEQII